LLLRTDLILKEARSAVSKDGDTTDSMVRDASCGRSSP
jgi:hypothetical protein